MKEIMIEIDFNSDEAIYMQLRNQIIMGDRAFCGSGWGHTSLGQEAFRADWREYAHGQQGICRTETGGVYSA